MRPYIATLSKMGQPLRALLSDYADVFKDLFSSCLNRPVKTLVYLSVAGGLSLGCVNRPDMRAYVNDVLEYSNELSMCSAAIRSPKAKRYIDSLITMETDGYLQCVNVGIASLIIRKHHSTYCSNYHKTCPSLQPRSWTVHERVVDIGVWGQWLLLETEMKDYDINSEQLE